MNKYLTELIGTFFLFLTIGLAVTGHAAEAPLAIGTVLGIMVYAGGHISGGHYNPAVTAAVWLRGRCATADVIPYWAAQVIGSSLAAVIVSHFNGGAATAGTFASAHKMLVAEFLFTFALCYVVLNVATAKVNANNSFFGLAIGLTVFVGATVVGPISGGAFNPAVAIGGCVLGIFNVGSLWIYLGAEFAAAIAAALVFKLANPTDV
jgi:aquaporin Z